MNALWIQVSSESVSGDGRYLSRNAFTALIIVVAALAASARAVPGAVDVASALVHAITDNKVLWVCLRLPP